MARGEYLGEFELYVLAALQHLGPEAYGVTIRAEIEERSGRMASLGAVYTTLDRLAGKGYVAFSVSDPLPVQGGRARKHARLTPAGRQALAGAVRSLDRMLGGVRLGLRGGTGRP